MKNDNPKKIKIWADPSHVFTVPKEGHYEISYNGIVQSKFMRVGDTLEMVILSPEQQENLKELKGLGT